MYKRIDDITDFGRIKEGTVLIRYPAIGLPETTLDLSDPLSYMRYQVHAIDGGIMHLKIPAENIDENIQPAEVPHMDGRDEPSTVLLKDIETMMAEMLWWLETE